MGDVTRWEPERGWFCDFDTGIWRRKPDGNYEPLPHGTVVIPEADHLAELERVRVETLREIRAAIQAKRDHWQARAERADEDSMVGRRYRDYFETHDADLAAIDRLIDATTKGATDD